MYTLDRVQLLLRCVVLVFRSSRFHPLPPNPPTPGTLLRDACTHYEIMKLRSGAETADISPRDADNNLPPPARGNKIGQT